MDMKNYTEQKKPAALPSNNWCIVYSCKMIEIKTVFARISGKENEVYIWVVEIIYYVVEGNGDLGTYICPKLLKFTITICVPYSM